MKTIEIKTLTLVLFLVVGKGRSDPQKPAISMNLNCNCGTFSKELLPYLQYLISEMNTTNTQGTKIIPKIVKGPALNCSPNNVLKNCDEVLKCGNNQSGVYTIDPDGKGPFKVYCDQTTDGGGWTVFQKRQDGSVDFYVAWKDYKNGFGDLKGEFWLGLDKIYRLTHQTRNRLRVDMSLWNNKTGYAKYQYFAIGGEKDRYKLKITETYSGNAGDSLTYFNGHPFFTRDRDTVYECAKVFDGAWWLRNRFPCLVVSHLNGGYLPSGKQPTRHNTGLSWLLFTGRKSSAKSSEMKIRPFEFDF